MTYKRKSGLLTVMILILVAALAAGALAALSDGFTDWEVSTWSGADNEDDVGLTGREESSGALIGNTDENGIKLMSTRIAPADYSENGVAPFAEAAYTLTATVEPATAANKTVNWSVADKAETSGTHSSPLPETETRMTKKELFDKLYDEYIELPRSKRKEAVLAEMLPYFKSESSARLYVDGQFERKQRNLISRRMRLARKVNMQEFDHFVTFTYSDKLHTEESFRKKLRNTLSHLCSRKGWRYVGVWERSPEKKRLHFHGLFHIPEGTMPGEMSSVSSYSFSSHTRQVTHQNSYFLEQFGRNDFEDITDARRIGDAIAYLTKYIEKFGEKIVYSRGLYAYFISDIMDDDVVCPIGIEDRKLLLFDDFMCFDEGVLMGRVCRDVIRRLRKCG